MTDRDLLKLVKEFETQVGLTSTDSRRSAFIALAYNRGWPSARIGRYLGVSRARVGQRVEKQRRYVETYKMPLLTSLLADARSN